MSAEDLEGLRALLRLTEARYSVLLEHAGDAIIVADRDGRIVIWNVEAERMFGYTAAEALGEPLTLILPDRFVARFQSAYRRAVTAGRTLGFDTSHALAGQRKDGGEFPIELTVAAVRENERIFFTGIIRDVTARVHLEEQLRRRNAELGETSGLLAGVLQCSTEHSIITLDRSGAIRIWNEGACRNYGYTATEVVGKLNYSALHTPEDVESGLVKRTLFAALRDGKFEGELTRVRKGGATFPAQVAITVRRDASGAALGFLVVSTDITARKQLEEELRQKNRELEHRSLHVQEANRLKSEFLTNMSHELRTPLNAIIGFTQLMADGHVGASSPEQQEFLGYILSSSRHLLQLINGLLDMAKIEAGKLTFHPEPVDLRTLVTEVRDILRPTAAPKEIQTDIEIDPCVSTVVTDPAKLKQILYNYLSNAFKFTPDQGRITIRAAPDGDTAFRLEVEDTGVGVRPEEIGRLFLEFQQLDGGNRERQPGSGLGLALTKRLAEAQGGSVDVRSVPHRGSVFGVRLPRTPAATDAEPIRRAKSAAADHP